jgi:hypothetical protein
MRNTPIKWSKRMAEVDAIDRACDVRPSLNTIARIIGVTEERVRQIRFWIDRYREQEAAKETCESAADLTGQEERQEPRQP